MTTNTSTQKQIKVGRSSLQVTNVGEIASLLTELIKEVEKMEAWDWHQEGPITEENGMFLMKDDVLTLLKAKLKEVSNE